jgi:hypothetical protein
MGLSPAVVTDTTEPTYLPQSPNRPPKATYTRLPSTVSAARSWWAIRSPWGGSSGTRTSTAPVFTFAPTSTCCPPVSSASANTREVAWSKAIVPVMPSGSTLPHGRLDRGTGSPMWVDQRTAPVAGSSA